MPLIKLTPDQHLRLHAALLAAFPTPQSLSALLISIGQNYDQLAVQAYNFKGNLTVVIQTAEAEDWLLPLVLKARDTIPLDPSFQQLGNELAPLAPAGTISDFKVCRLTGSYVLIDRAVLRESVEILSQPLGKRILVVTGGDRAGKSHSMQLISYLYLRRSQFKLVPIDLEAYQRLLGPDQLIEPIHLARGLVRKLPYQVEIHEAPDDAQWASWVLEFCEDFEARALDDPEWRWIVIDAFNKVPVKQPTFDLVKELARRISTSLPRYRLVLLGYRESLDRAVYPTLATEDIGPIGKLELAEFFAVAFDQHGIPTEPRRLAATVRRVLKGLDPKDADYLATVGQRASDELEKAASKAGGR
jgi:hypothetical protein